MDDQKKTGWDVLVSVLAWAALAVGPLESMFNYLSGTPGIGVPGWTITLLGGILHVLRIKLHDLLTPAKSHNVGALVLGFLGLVSALLPYIVGALKGIGGPDIPSTLDLPDVFPADVPVAGGFLALGLPGLLARLRRLVARGPGALALACVLLGLLTLPVACVKLPAQVRTDAVKVASVYDGYVAAQAPAHANPETWKADRLRLSAQFREVTGSTWASWSWRDVAVTVTCFVERAAAHDPEVTPGALASLKETTRGIRVQTKLPADCPAVGGGVP